MDKVLTVENLTLAVGSGDEEKTLLTDVSFSLEKGRCLGILGESGSGKSLTAKSIMGILDRGFRVEGRILADGVNLLEKSEEEMRRMRGKEIGMIMQNPMTSFDPLYTIGNQMYETFEAHGVFSRGEYEQRAISVLEFMRIRNCEDVLRKYPHQLSGGMLQRVMIGIAMAMKPKVLIADEPTTAIDSITQYEIVNEFNRIKESGETALIFITHDIGVISQMADDIMVLNKGRVADFGSAHTVIREPKDAYTKLLIEKKEAVYGRYHAVLKGVGV